MGDVGLPLDPPAERLALGEQAQDRLAVGRLRGSTRPGATDLLEHERAAVVADRDPVPSGGVVGLLPGEHEPIRRLAVVGLGPLQVQARAHRVVPRDREARALAGCHTGRARVHRQEHGEPVAQAVPAERDLHELAHLALDDRVAAEEIGRRVEDQQLRLVAPRTSRRAASRAASAPHHARIKGDEQVVLAEAREQAQLVQLRELDAERVADRPLAPLQLVPLLLGEDADTPPAPIAEP